MRLKHEDITEARTANKVLSKVGVTGFYDSLVLNRTLVFQINSSAKNPHHRQYLAVSCHYIELSLSKKPGNIASIFVLLEIGVGIMVGIIYINSLGEPESSLLDSILNFYIVLNSIFFGITVLLGAITSFLIKRTARILIAILLSLAGGIGLLIVHALIIPVPIFSFFPLFGFIIGFNYYLLKGTNSKKENATI